MVLNCSVLSSRNGEVGTVFGDAETSVTIKSAMTDYWIFRQKYGGCYANDANIWNLTFTNKISSLPNSSTSGAKYSFDVTDTSKPFDENKRVRAYVYELTDNETDTVYNDVYFYAPVDKIFAPEDMSYFFAGWDHDADYTAYIDEDSCENHFKSIVFDGFYADYTTNTDYMFTSECGYQDLTSFDMSIFEDSNLTLSDSTFSGCFGITNIYIPKGITAIDGDPFGDFDDIDNITVSNQNTHFKVIDGVLFSYDGTILYKFPSCSESTTYSIPNGVSIINRGAFYNCSNLQSITIPQSVESIGDNAFLFCGDLTEIVIPNLVTEIGHGTFCGCSNLTSITLPNNLTSIGDRAFDGCSSLTSLSIPNSIASIGLDVFINCYSLSYNQYGNAKYLGNANNPYIIFVKINDSSTTNCEINSNTKVISSDAFAYCYYLNNITIPSGVLFIGNGAFRSCRAFTSVTIPNSVNYIDENAFSCCDNLQSITFEANSNLTSIGGWAFGGCTVLNSITIPSSVAHIDSLAFSSCSSLQSINVESGSSYYKSIDGVLFNRNMTELVTYPRGKSGTNYTIPNSVKTIGSFAFAYSNLTNISIPSSVNVIGAEAFNSSKITNMVIPNSVKKVGYNTFWGCEDLADIAISNSVTDICGSTFYGCNSLVTLIIPNTVKTIGNSAFSNCSNLKSICIPQSVKLIKDCAFEGCEGLEEIWTASKIDVLSLYGIEGTWYDYVSTDGNTITQNVTVNANNGWKHYFSLSDTSSQDLFILTLSTTDDTKLATSANDLWTLDSSDKTTAYVVCLKNGIYGELPQGANNEPIIWKNNNSKIKSFSKISNTNDLSGEMSTFPNTGVGVDIILPSAIILTLTVAIMFVAFGGKKRKIIVK